MSINQAAFISLYLLLFMTAAQFSVPFMTYYPTPQRGQQYYVQGHYPSVYQGYSGHHFTHPSEYYYESHNHPAYYSQPMTYGHSDATYGTGGAVAHAGNRADGIFIHCHTAKCNT
ncbi:hypothetical protein AB6A40_000890 [Gnathostoma spinigerum]|uniref:Uncharacterized protein n=1 Tax=Gnathostoma spinigerum TaxID=75299 RepID=A0ABD6E487_9BILA